MKQLSRWSASIVALGSSFVVAATLLHYAQAHRLGVPGGYLAVGIGAVSVGVLAGAGTYFSTASGQRNILVAIAAGAIVSLAAAGVLMVTLVWAFGS